jgi:hypothetical protein
MSQQAQPAAAISWSAKALPNPSIEGTSTGWARYARCSFSAKPVTAAHLYVRQHRNMCALPAPHRAASGKFRCDRAVAAKFKRVRALGALALNLSRKSKHCATGSLNTYKSLGLLFAVGCPRKPARAARHSAGCSPTAVRVRSGCVRVSPCSLPLRQAGAKLDERDRCVFSDLP